MSRDALFRQAAEALGFAPDGEIKAGGNYVPVLRDGATVYISGQVPRIGNAVVVTGRAGAEVALEQAQRAAKICTLRALALLQRELGSLNDVRQILRLTVYVQCSPDFTHHSEVADAASGLLQQILGPAGMHTRTSVGVFQLPKNATVELDLIASAR
ncbi:MAG: RidA family protein [Hylemonella sp.]|uniref:RidA family protein n=1 Tax=Hylemonella sp. TaxID=2066020 RepID=UPI0022C6C449|nr:RidA family protein [Hylemonella sp.]MCZ8250960.1 RidA family protein [Hylemonella sp.]